MKLKELEERAEKLKSANESLNSENKDLNVKVKDLESEKANYIAKGTQAGIGYRNGSSLEQQAMTAFGCTNAKQLLGVNTGAARFNNVSDEKKSCVIALKQAVDTSRWMQQIFHGEQKDSFSNIKNDIQAGHVKGALDNYFGKNELVPRLKAFGTGVTNGGAEWIPTGVSQVFIEEFQLVREVANLWRSINMPTNPFEMPIQNSKSTARISAENTSFTAGDFSTDKITMSATKLQEYYVLPTELTEDSAPDFLAIGRSDVVNAIGRAEETAQINGSLGTHIDSDTQAGLAILAEKAWEGLRSIAIANSANGATPALAGALTDAFMRSMRKAMGRMGVNPLDLAWICSPIGYQQILGLNDVRTHDVFGPNATITKGSIDKYQGIPIINSEFMRDDLNASGVYDGVTTTKTGIMLVNKTRFMRGVRRPIQMRVMQDLLDQDRVQIAALSRLAFNSMPQSDTEVSAVYGIDITA